jgi:hypothetical protein
MDVAVLTDMDDAILINKLKMPCKTTRKGPISTGAQADRRPEVNNMRLENLCEQR